MVRETNPRKKQQNQRDEREEIPLKAKKKNLKEKYRHQNNWLEDYDDELEIDLFGEDEDYNFEDELGTDFISEYDKEFEDQDSNEEEEDNY